MVVLVEVVVGAGVETGETETTVLSVHFLRFPVAVETHEWEHPSR